jgi:hypothetical protein
VLTASAMFGPTRGLTRFGGQPGAHCVATRSAAVGAAGPGPSSQRLAAQAAAAAEESQSPATQANVRFQVLIGHPALVEPCHNSRVPALE